MEAQKWTKGPWKFSRLEGSEELYRLQGREMPDHEGYFRENDGSWVVGYSNEHSQGRIAAIDFKGKAKRGQGWTAPDPEGMANARLIAAAPELYEALEAVMQLFKAVYPDDANPPILEKAEAALAKARGI